MSPRSDVDRFRKLLTMLLVFIGSLTPSQRGKCQNPVVGTAAPSSATIDNLDERPPLPSQLKSAQVQIMHRDRAIFAAIEDDKPLASEKQNAREYDAWTEVVLHAKKFSAQELEKNASRDLTVADLTIDPESRATFRLDLIRFDGKLTRARRVRATKSLEEAGVAEMFEAWLIPEGEFPSSPVCLLFLDWPAKLPNLPERSVTQDATPYTEIEQKCSFAGFSFKLMGYPDSTDPLNSRQLRVPLLVGKSLTPQAERNDLATSVELRKSLRIFNFIRDDAKSASTREQWGEIAAWNRVLYHANQIPVETLEANARRNLTFADLFQESRLDYHLDLVYLEGTLIRLKQGTSNKQMIDAGIPLWYEGWLVPKGEIRGNPVCIVLTELPPGLDAKLSMGKFVSFAGYSFKLMRYESAEVSKDDPTQNVWKRAPMLIGRSVVVRDNLADGPATWATWFIPTIVAGLLSMVVTAFALSWWFRRGDLRAIEAMAAIRQKNPFD